MGYGDSLGVTLPTVGATNGGGLNIATMINAAIQACVDRLQTKVTVSGLDINADLSFKSGSTNYAAKDVSRVSLYNQPSALSAVTYPQALYTVGSALYFNDNSGNQVRIVNNGAIDISGVGGITGAGYGTGGIEVTWTGAQYNFKLGTGGDDFAPIKVNDVLLHDGSGNFIRLDAPAMSADYTLTFPAAPPSVASFLTMDAGAGIVTTPAAYASGTFTPVLQNAGADHAGGYSAQQGSYVRIGNMIFFTLRVIATTLNPAGTLAIKAASLPVTPSTATVAEHSCTITYFGPATPPGQTEVTATVYAGGIFIGDNSDLSKNWAALTEDTYHFLIAGHYLVA